MNAPLPLELRLETSKRLGNLQLNYLKSISQWQPIWANYYRCQFCLHLHINFPFAGMWCASYRRIRRSEFGVLKRQINNNVEIGRHGCELPMFVWVRNNAKNLRPTASHARLQIFNACDMAGVDTLQVGVYPSSEALFRVFNGKLCKVLRDAGIELCELENEIIKGASQVVTDLPHQNGDTHRGRDTHRGIKQLRQEDYRFVRGLRIELGDNSIGIELGDSRYTRPQISKVFLCPDCSFESAIEYVRGHGTLHA